MDEDHQDRLVGGGADAGAEDERRHDQ